MLSTAHGAWLPPDSPAGQYDVILLRCFLALAAGAIMCAGKRLMRPFALPYLVQHGELLLHLLLREVRLHLDSLRAIGCCCCGSGCCQLMLLLIKTLLELLQGSGLVGGKHSMSGGWLSA